jgi:DNA-binding response OmpR family regulator
LVKRATKRGEVCGAMNRVLLVAPADDFARAFAARLDQEGAHTKLASSAAEALAVAAVDGFDVIVLDLELPDADGLTVLRQLRAGSALLTPILLLKGEGEPAHLVQRGLDFGASGYVIKHRLPRNLATARLLEHLSKAANGRPDACPFSARREFGRCSVFLPLSIAVAEAADEPSVSCSHLRIGTSDTWRLYPRCAIGDQMARDHYLQDKTPV